MTKAPIADSLDCEILTSPWYTALLRCYVLALQRLVLDDNWANLHRVVLLEPYVFDFDFEDISDEEGEVDDW